MEKVLEKHEFELPSNINSRVDVKGWFELAISVADIRELHKLDELYCQERIK